MYADMACRGVCFFYIQNFGEHPRPLRRDRVVVVLVVVVWCQGGGSHLTWKQQLMDWKKVSVGEGGRSRFKL